jgi:dipeptidyl aminopeptidase/acylaminoacyl peptidase
MPRTLALLVLAACALPEIACRAQTAPPSAPIPESIRAEQVPPVPAALTLALNRYQNIRSASFQDWDDSQERAVYVTTRFADTPQVHHVPRPGAARRQLTFQRERVLRAASRPKHDQFLMVMDEGGAENYQLFLHDRTGGEPRRITDGKSRNIAPKWSPSGELLAWSGNARNGRDMDLYLAAPADPHFRRPLKEVSGQWTAADWSPDESKVVAEEFLSIQESYIHMIDIGTNQVTTITPRRTEPAVEPSAASDPRWSKDGRSIYFITDKGSEFRRLARYELASGTTKTVTDSIPWDVEEYDLSDDGVYIALVANEDGRDVLHVFQAATLQEQFLRAKLPPGQISGLKFRPGSLEIGFTRSTAQEASDAYSWNIFQGAAGPRQGPGRRQRRVVRRVHVAGRPDDV